MSTQEEQEEIDQQQELLRIHRRNLRRLQLQAARSGGEPNVSTEIANRIDDAREEIRKCEEVLRHLGAEVEDPPIEPPTPSGVPRPLHPEPRQNILLVDDDPDITNNLKPILEHAGFTVHIAFDGETALDHVKTNRVDLIILDFVL